jgi:two-component system, chemotaxis family, protein-glutamate methylesterase/glutaminase
MHNRVIVIGSSMHGIETLRRLVGALPADFPAPILVAQHLGATSLGALPEILSKAGRLKAVHPQGGEAVEAGRIYVAPPDRHMLLEKNRVYLSHGPRENFVRPAADPLFRSAALAYGPAVVGVVLTGQLDDGTAGLLAIKDNGGTAIVQDPEEAAAPSMPRSALRHVKVDHCLPVAGIADELVRLARDDPDPPAEDADRILLAIEHRIAAGIFNALDWMRLEQRSVPSGLNCPDCRSALYEIRDPRLLRFRCRAGHAWSALSLLGAQADAHEKELSFLFGLAMEEAALAKRLEAMRESREDLALAAGLRARIEVLESEGEQVAGWLHAVPAAVPAR